MSLGVIKSDYVTLSLTVKFLRMLSKMFVY